MGYYPKNMWDFFDAEAFRRSRATFIGRAGEYFVTSQLLRLGFNAMPLSVDSGVDLVAQRPSKSGDSFLYLFQVKTTARGTYEGTWTSEQLHGLVDNLVNLVFVFWPESGSPFSLVVPPTLLTCLIDEEKSSSAPIVLRGGKARVKVFSDRDRRVFMRNKSNELTGMTDRFACMEDTNSDTSHFPPYAEWGEDEKTHIRILSDEELAKYYDSAG